MLEKITNTFSDVIRKLNGKSTITEKNIEETETKKEQTIGQVEVGSNFKQKDKWSAYGRSHYTYGSGYDATAVGLGVSYNW